jgi:hypothetical protein
MSTQAKGKYNLHLRGRNLPPHEMIKAKTEFISSEMREGEREYFFLH